MFAKIGDLSETKIDYGIDFSYRKALIIQMVFQKKNYINPLNPIGHVTHYKNLRNKCVPILHCITFGISKQTHTGNWKILKSIWGDFYETVLKRKVFSEDDENFGVTRALILDT